MFGAIYGSNLVLGLNRASRNFRAELRQFSVSLSCPLRLFPSQRPNPLHRRLHRRPIPAGSGESSCCRTTYPAPPPPLLIPWRGIDHSLHHDELRPSKIPTGRRRLGLPQRGSYTTPCVGTQCRPAAGRPSSSRGPAVGPSARGWTPASSAPPPPRSTPSLIGSSRSEGAVQR
jgi:hypothetical protein